MGNCIFCKIAKGEIESEIVWENEDIAAFRDVNPQAPTHILLIPKKHIPMISKVQPEDQPLLGEMVYAAKTVAEQEELDEQGYRLVFNNGDFGGQDVYHIHLHLLGGRPMKWPPG